MLLTDSIRLAWEITSCAVALSTLTGGENMIASRSRLSRGLCTIVIGVAGLALGGMIAASPAAAHFKPSLSHVWGHIKKLGDVRYLQPAQGDARYLQPAQGDARYLQPAQGDAAYVRKADVATLRGVYIIKENNAAVGTVTVDSISFNPLTFSVSPTPHILREGAASTAECPGNPANPQAAPGHFCLYEAQMSNIGLLGVQDPVQAPGTVGTYGTMVFGIAAANGSTESRGTWAATLP
jgi:hypothetical protein